ncbi:MULTISPECIES: winged helix-turn-helix domain-containing protein [Subtercola]|uniref:Winged helix-turn-helix domain-containing protein n=1 Tax=Subtercola vilae TaxID=2056433 RepID=A0A4T2BYU6_9MICO|nr:MULTISPECIES: crosslink repair DNA glycosylase YcaQ family protein [Subtercola]MEA9985725.1 crosslink repair DNA glycosylase YcaQ family protein [Subtercola sp. RTI3]TIH37133.1 winged helix-turn-helix domain-containing protein [Subtercola vilae]
MVATISPGLARRVALGAQGFGRASGSQPGVRQLNALVGRLGLLQIDSVNVFERSHYMPAFSRLGAYDKAELDRVTYGKRMIEYWAHEASFIPLETLPLMRWRMNDYRVRALAESDSWAAANPQMISWLLAELAEKGPLAASAIEHESNVRNGPWWGWSDVKRGLETLFRWGDVVTAGRTRFERVYALPSQVLPPAILDAEVPRAEAVRQLVSIAARAHGIGTAADLVDYFRLKGVDALPAIHELEESGELLPVTVAGWQKPAWLHRDARLPRRIEADALLTPFDPVVWLRSRAERMFDFHYRIEIYTPEPKRVFGYYVLPVLLDERIVGRVDLKNDRQAGLLRVQAAWIEPNPPDGTAERLAALLRRTAAWQNLSDVTVAPRGSFAAPLAAALAAP